MATKLYEFEGTVKFAKIYEPDVYNGASRYLMNFYPKNEAQKSLIRRSGIQLVEKSDEDGAYFAFRRDAEKKIKRDFMVFTPPFVYDADGKELVGYYDKKEGKRVYSYNIKEDLEIERRGDPIIIGNGSGVKLRVAVYDTGQGKGHRVENIMITDLVEYAGSGRGRYITAEDMADAGEPEVEGTDFTDLDTKPEDMETKTKTTSKRSKIKEDDLPW